MKKEYYKLSPEIRDFILAQAKERPELGCRKLAGRIEQEFKFKLSKSSINAVIKQAGLSKKAGRPRSSSLVSRPASLVIRPCLAGSPLGEAEGRQASSIDEINSQIEPGSEVFTNKVLGIKFILADKTFFFMDAAFNTVWPDSHIPVDFSAALTRLKARLNDCLFLENNPLVLQVVAGYGEPKGAFWDFAASFGAQDPAKALSGIELYGELQGLLGIVEQVPAKKVNFIIGLWPWQYKDKAVFGALRFIEYAPQGALRFCLLTNLKEESWPDQKVAQVYLEHWPFPEKSYQRLLEKIIRL